MAGETSEKVDIEQFRGKPLGRILVRMKAVTRDRIQEALEVQKSRGGPLGEILVDLGYINEDLRAKALGYQAGMDLSLIHI